jgi:hypothetical protein
VHAQHWEQLAKSDRRQTAGRAQCAYSPEGDSFSISMLNREYLADLTEKTVWFIGDGSDRRPAGFIEQLCVLTYLCSARDVPLAQKLVSVERLDPGGFFFRGSHELPIRDLESVFGPDPDLVYTTGRSLDASRRTFGDASIDISVLPRIPMTLIIWRADEEFPARASVLFDQTASTQMPLDALYAVTSLALKRILSAAHARA